MLTVEQFHQVVKCVCVCVYLYAHPFLSFAYSVLIVAYSMNASAGTLGRRHLILMFVGFGWMPCHITAHEERNFKAGLGAWFFSPPNRATESSAF